MSRTSTVIVNFILLKYSKLQFLYLFVIFIYVFYLCMYSSAVSYFFLSCVKCTYLLLCPHYNTLHSKNLSKKTVRSDCKDFCFHSLFSNVSFWHARVVWFNKGKEFHKYFAELILSNFVKYSYVITPSRRIYLSIFLVCGLCALWIRKLNQWMFIKLLFHEENCGKRNLSETFMEA